jgi:RNA binding exosome subunit
MKKSLLIILIFSIFLSQICYAGFLDDILGGIQTKAKEAISDKETLTESKVISGLKEALSIGTQNAVDSVSKVDGYYGNPAIKILMPEKLQKVAEVLAKVGFEKQVNDLVLSMNRAAEKATPEAIPIFIDAIKGMSFEDAKNILDGGDTAATDYFKIKTSAKLFDKFKPTISESMKEVGVTRIYKTVMTKYESIPFVQKESFDIDHYITNKSLEGLFHMVGQEEKKIRTDPAARVTELLKDVFGK